MRKPVQWIHLNTIDPDLPMLVCACNPASPSYQANDLALLDHVPLLDQDPGLMPETAVYSPAMVDDGGISTHG